MVLRYFYLQHHYRTPIDFSFQELDAAQTAYKKIITHIGQNNQATKTIGDYSSLLASNKTAQLMLEALCDDLNTPKFLGLVFENLAIYKQDPDLSSLVHSLLQHVLGLTLQPIKEEAVAITPEIEALIKQREQARKEKNWPLADKLRDELAKLGYQVSDKKS